jgi:hypothetical protein
MTSRSDEKQINHDPDDLDALLERVNAAVYRHSPELEYVPIPQGVPVKFEDYKRNSKDWNWKQIFKNKTAFFEERNGKLIFKRSKGETYVATIKIGFYNKKDGPLKAGSAPNVDMRTTYILNELVALGKLRWVMLSIANVDLDLDQLREFPTVYSVLETAKSRKESTKVYVQVLEHYARHSSLMFWLQTQQIGDREWKALLFRLLLILAKLQEEYPLFRHNLYNPESMEVYVVERGRVDQATLDDMIIEIEDPGFEVRLCDFQHSTGVDSIVNEDISPENRQPDPLHDQRTLSRWLLKHLKLHGQTAGFIKEMGASKLTPRELLTTNRYFDEIRCPKNKSQGKYKKEEMDSESSLSSRSENSPEPVVLLHGMRRAFKPHLLRIERSSKHSGDKSRKRLEPKYVETVSTESFGGAATESTSSSEEVVPVRKMSNKSKSTARTSHKPVSKKIDSFDENDSNDDDEWAPSDAPKYKRYMRRLAAKEKEKDNEENATLTAVKRKEASQAAAARGMEVHFTAKDSEPTGMQRLFGVSAGSLQVPENVRGLSKIPQVSNGESMNSTSMNDTSMQQSGQMPDIPSYNSLNRQKQFDVPNQMMSQGMDMPPMMNQGMGMAPPMMNQGMGMLPPQQMMGMGMSQPQQMMGMGMMPQQQMMGNQSMGMGMPQQQMMGNQSMGMGMPQQQMMGQGMYPPQQGGGGYNYPQQGGYSQYGAGTDPRFFF